VAVAAPAFGQRLAAADVLCGNRGRREDGEDNDRSEHAVMLTDLRQAALI
jgi:hypothetical protein